MSNQINEEGNNQRTATDSLSWKDEERLYNKGRATILWYAPPKHPDFPYEKSANGVNVNPGHVYLGGNGVPTWEDDVVDMTQLIHNREQIKSARTSDVYKGLVDPFIGDWKK